MLNNQHFADFRAKSLGGSDIAAILGLSPYRTAVDVWKEKTGKQREIKDSLPLRFGSFAEEFVAQEYALQTSNGLINYPHAITHSDYEYFGGHIDRYIYDKNSKPSEPTTGNVETKSHPHLSFENGKLVSINGQHIKKLLECKTANPFMQQQWGEAGTDQVPLPYLCQCHWYMAITKVKYADVAVLFGNADFRIYELEQDPELEAALIDKAQLFWTQYVQKDNPPLAQSEADYQKIFAKPIAAKSVEAPELLVDQLNKVSRLQEQIHESEDQLSKIKQLVMDTMQDAEILSHQGKTLATWKLPKPSLRLNTKLLEQEHPQLIAKYQIASQNSRRLLLKAAGN